MTWRKAPGANFATPRRGALDGNGKTVTTRRLKLDVAAGRRA